VLVGIGAMQQMGQTDIVTLEYGVVVTGLQFRVLALQSKDRYRIARIGANVRVA